MSPIPAVLTSHCDSHFESSDIMLLRKEIGWHGPEFQNLDYNISKIRGIRILCVSIDCYKFLISVFTLSPYLEKQYLGHENESCRWFSPTRGQRGPLKPLAAPPPKFLVQDNRKISTTREICITQFGTQVKKYPQFE